MQFQSTSAQQYPQVGDKNWVIRILKDLIAHSSVFTVVNESREDKGEGVERIHCRCGSEKLVHRCRDMQSMFKVVEVHIVVRCSNSTHKL